MEGNEIHGYRSLDNRGFSAKEIGHYTRVMWVGRWADVKSWAAAIMFFRIKYTLCSVKRGMHIEEKEKKTMVS